MSSGTERSVVKDLGDVHFFRLRYDTEILRRKLLRMTIVMKIRNKNSVSRRLCVEKTKRSTLHPYIELITQNS